MKSLLFALLALAAIPAQAQSRAQWSITGGCNEYSYSGTYIQALDLSYCRASQGSEAKWSITGGCNEYTPTGIYIQALDRNSCRANQGSTAQWSITGTCNEYTPTGIYIQALDPYYCRIGRAPGPAAPVVIAPAPVYPVPVPRPNTHQPTVQSDRCYVKQTNQVVEGEQFFSVVSNWARSNRRCAVAKIAYVPNSGRIYQADGSRAAKSSGGLSNNEVDQVLRNTGLYSCERFSCDQIN